MAGQERTLRPPTRNYRAIVVFLLMLYSLCSWADRTVISTIGQAIKADLKISDTQLGLLHGFAFSILYVLLSLPAARLAERYNRTTIIAASLAFWSVFTFLSGFARSFSHLLLARIGVGVGEACANPAAYSLITDYFGPRRRASALSVYQVGLPLGIMAGAICGGMMTEYFGWRSAFFLLGLPGLVLAVVIRLVIRELPRGYSDGLEGRVAPSDAVPTIAQTARCLFGTATARHFIAGITLFTFVNFGAGVFVAPFFIRAFGLNYVQIGLIIGFGIGGANAVGTFAGGFVADFFARRSARAYALVPMTGLLIALPLMLLAYQQTDWRVAIGLLGIASISQFVNFSPAYATIFNLVEARMRATATALISLVASLVALVIGTAASGALMDFLSERAFTGGGFFVACPGGAAAPGSSAALISACATAIDQSTRLGLSICALALGWAALHFFLASRSIESDLRAAALRGGQL